MERLHSISGKSILGQNFVNSVSNFFRKNDSFLTDFEIEKKLPSTAVENKSILTTLSHLHCLK